jgi:hypothetical protein
MQDGETWDPRERRLQGDGETWDLRERKMQDGETWDLRERRRQEGGENCDPDRYLTTPTTAQSTPVL